MRPIDRVYQDCTILHVDADPFFAAVEQALDPRLRGRPVVTGAERGIIAAASYEAKAFGIKRGVQLHEAKAMCPDLVILPSDYESYSHYSKMLYAILRRFTPLVEEYSVDEAFGDLSGCGSVLGLTLEQVAERLRGAVRTEMGLTRDAAPERYGTLMLGEGDRHLAIPRMTLASMRREAVAQLGLAASVCPRSASLAQRDAVSPDSAGSRARPCRSD